LYVTAELANAIDVIDPATRKVLAEIPTGQRESHMLVISPDGRRAYTANVGAGSVSVLDLSKRTLIAAIPVAKKIQRISISPDGSRVYTHDQDSPRVAIIDTATNKISGWIELPASAYASASTPDGRWLLAVSQQKGLFVVELSSGKVAHSFEAPKNSSEILIRPGGDVAYVSGTGDGKIAVYDLHTWEARPPIELSPGVDGLAWLPASRK
jgi:YVTN family beta-propeller protein